MAYALIILEAPGDRQARPEAERRDRYDRMLGFSHDLKNRGLLTVSQSLMSDVDGARVNLQGGANRVTDGPFAEAKEMIGGFLLLTCESRAEAIALATQCPAAEWATVEVRKLGPCFG